MFQEDAIVISREGTFWRNGNITCRNTQMLNITPKCKNYLCHCLFSRWVAMNKMVCHFWHQFLTQFSLLFQMVPFFFLSMAALRTTNTKLSDWLLELFQPIRLWLSELPYRAKWMVPSERALKTKSETGVESFTPFCWGSSFRKTNSVIGQCLLHEMVIIRQ